MIIYRAGDAEPIATRHGAATPVLVIDNDGNLTLVMEMNE